MVAQLHPNRNNPIAAQLSPSSLEAEENILGGILLDAEAFPRVKDLLEPKHFYVPSHQILYRRITELFASKGTTDFISVQAYLQDKNELTKIGGILKLSQLLDHTVSAVNIDTHAGLVIQKWLQRETQKLAHNLIEFSQHYQSGDLSNWYEEKNIDPKNILDNHSLYLGIVEEQVHALTRGRYRDSLNKDSDTATVDRIIQKIKNIENNFEKLEYKRFKIVQLAKEYKISERQLESIYLSSLLSDNNEPIRTLAELRAAYGENLNDWFIQGMLPKGSVVLLHALGGVGKTRLAYDFCYSMASGTSWGGQFPVTAPSRRCLLVQTDESANDMVRSLNARGFNDDHGIFVKTKWSFDNLASLRREIIENQIEVVVLDSLTALNRNTIVSENDTEYARPILQLKDLAQELGISILLIHHSNSEGKSRGTKAIHNSVSQVLSLKFPSEGSKTSSPERLLIIEKSRFRRPTQYKLAFEFDYETGQWFWKCEGEEGEEERDTFLKDQIVRFLRNQRNRLFTADQLAKKLGAAYNSVRKCLFELSELDQVISRKRSNKKGRPWLHFLKWENDCSPNHDPDPGLTDLTDPDNLTDLTDLEGEDQREPAQDADFQLTDPFSAKNPEKILEKIPKNEDQEDQRDQVESETSITQELEPVTSLISEADHLPDQREKTMDQDQREDQRADKPEGEVQESLSSTETNNDSSESPAGEKSSSALETENQESSSEKTEGIRVSYCGNDPNFKQTLLYATNLRMVGITENAMAILKADNWSVEREVPFSDLQ
ncbi:AAA family ATPase [Crocosphaera sp. Alani8]|uniref:AAA family ATPase n=1 Tax=Crocosphaera sp. Alani8 TaxID=3038952 RepID=UPI00313E0532